MRNRSGEKIKLASIDELLGVVNEESAMEIDISKIHAFKDHPFKVLDDEKMTDLVESVKAKGVLTPVLLDILKDALEALEETKEDPLEDDLLETIASAIGKLQMIEDKYYYSLDLNRYLNNLEDDAYEE